MILDPATFGLDYTLDELPRDANGDVMYRGSSPEEYTAYTAWLADYLYRADARPSNRQAELCRFTSAKNKELAVQIVAMNAALYDNALAGLDVAIFTVLPDMRAFTETDVDNILRYLKDEEEADLHTCSPAQEEPTIVVTSLDLTREYTRESVTARINELSQERDRLGELCEAFCDVGWRVPLSIIIRDVDVKATRIQMLRHFFMLYHEYAVK